MTTNEMKILRALSLKLRAHALFAAKDVIIMACLKYPEENAVLNMALYAWENSDSDSIVNDCCKDIRQARKWIKETV